MTRTGKIARLPRQVREQLNRRLHDGELGTQLVVWLNGLPEVQAVIAREFGGRAISEQNLSEWKQGGYPEWTARQDALAEVREFVADARELAESAEGALTEHVATLLAARYAKALANWQTEPTEEARRTLRSLRGVCQDVVELRRGDLSAARLKIEQERLTRERDQTEAEVVEFFQRWAQYPRVRAWICSAECDPDERERRLWELFGLTPAPPAPIPVESPGAQPPAATGGDKEESD